MITANDLLRYLNKYADPGEFHDISLWEEFNMQRYVFRLRKIINGRCYSFRYVVSAWMLQEALFDTEGFAINLINRARIEFLKSNTLEKTATTMEVQPHDHF